MELAEFPGAGSVVVRGILLDIAELEQLDVLIDGDLAKGIGPHHREYIWTDRQVGLDQKTRSEHIPVRSTAKIK